MGSSRQNRGSLPCLPVESDRERATTGIESAAADGGLRQFGYRQELIRVLGGFSSFALAFSVVSVLTGAITLFDYGLTMGGPAEMTFGWPIVAFFTFFVAMSMAELASMVPTAGAAYHWSCKLGGKGWGWFTAWLIIVGYVTAIAGVDYGCAQFIMSLAGWPHNSSNLLICFAFILLSHALLNQYGIKLVAKLNDASVVLNVVGLVGIIGLLLCFASKQPLSFLLSTDNHVAQKAVQPYGLAFVLGLLQAQWTLSGYDSSATVSEETTDPARTAPRGILIAVGGSAVVGYLLLISLTLAIKDLPALLSTTSQSATPMVISILIGALGPVAGGASTVLAVMAMWCCGLLAVTACSRIIYAFSRDGGMPLSRTWSTVGGCQTPAAAIWLTVTAAFLSSVCSGAYEVVTSISTVALYLAYIAPVFLLWRKRRSGLRMGPWNLGRFGTVVNLVAIVWTLFISIILCIPNDFRAGKSMLVVLLALSACYVLYERKRFVGPPWFESDATAGALEGRGQI